MARKKAYVDPGWSVKSILLLLCMAAAQEERLIVRTLNNLAYNDQVIQTPMGEQFQYQDHVPWASFAGGTTILINGTGFLENPQLHSVGLYSKDLEQLLPSFPISEDDAFRSSPGQGLISYKLPHLKDLFGLDYEMFDQYYKMEFELFLDYQDELLGPVRSRCLDEDKCRIIFWKQYTPVVYQVSPPVVYFDSELEIWFDPKVTQDLITGLKKDEFIFINTKIGNYMIDFEEYMTHETDFSAFYRNSIRGRSGDQPVGLTNDVTMLWEVGNAHVIDQESQHCNFDQSECYVVKTIPVIKEVSANSGFKTGGQHLTLKGHGFTSSEDVLVKVGDTECVVFKASNEELTCKMNPAAALPDLTQSYVGQRGLKRLFFNGTSSNHFGLNDFEAEDTQEWISKEETLALQLEAPYQIGDYYWQKYTGWFVPPVSGRYRFYISCDDDCRLIFGNTPNNSTDVSQIHDIYSSTIFREYWRTTDGNERQSEWLTLTKDEPYYIELRHFEWNGGNDHVSVAVEIEQSEMVDHHKSFKEVQKLMINVENNLETFRLTLTDLDDGEYVLVFQHPETMEYVVSKNIKVTELSKWTLRSAVYDYYARKMGTDIEVDVVMLDENGMVTEDRDLKHTIILEFKCQRLSSSKRVQSITLSKVSTSATITLETPDQVQLSSPPLSGQYKIKCVDKDGFESFSETIEWHHWENWVNEKVMRGCAQMYDKLEIYEGQDFRYKQNGVSLILHFVGLNEDPGQFEIVQDAEATLTGANNITFSAETVHPFSTNLFYDPVPYEMLRTFEKAPQIEVQVGQFHAACHNLNCEYVFEEPVGEVTGFTFDEATKVLTLTGTELPLVADEIIQIDFALSQCEVNIESLTGTDIECTLVADPTCGNHVPVLTTFQGIIPNAETIEAQTIECTITDASPLTGHNLLGADNITFVGTNFPRDLSTSNVEIVFNDEKQTPCIPQISSSNELVCLTDAFDQSLSPGQIYTPTVTINGIAVANTLEFGLRTVVNSAMTLTPSSVSPTLKSRILIELESDFPNSLSKDDFTVNLTSQSDASYIRYLNVVEVDDSAKTLLVLFGGAWSGKYDVHIRHSVLGLLNTQGLVLDVGSTVTSVSPLSGSINGGTVLTITGTNFGTEFTDNPVQISYNGGVGSTDCFLFEISSTEIKCRVDSGIQKAAGESGKVVVFQKTSEEATCVDPTCLFTFSEDGVPTVTSFTPSFDETDWLLTAAGSGFEGDASSVVLKVGGVLQETVSVSSTEAVFKVTNVSKSVYEENIHVYFPVGTPNSHSIIESGFSLTHKFTKVEPSSGSAGGSLISAFVPGVGVDQADVGLTDEEGNSICQSAWMASYQTLKCYTLAEEIQPTTVKAKIGSSIVECSDPTYCSYQQLVSDPFPQISAVSIADSSTITLTGTNFFTSGYDASLKVAGAEASTVTITSDTEISASWDHGIPALVDPAALNLTFHATDSGLVHGASSAVTLENPISVTDSSSDLSCSFAGGCSYQITANGLTTLLSGGQAKIQVCETECELDLSSSDANSAICKLPSLSTSYSNLNFGVSSPGILKSGRYFGSGTDIQNSFDGNLLNSNTDQNSDCYIGTEFKEGFVAVLDRAKFYLPMQSGIYSGNLVFQGSADNMTWTDIYTADDRVHHAWNTIEFGPDEEIDQPAFRFYRFKGSSAGACELNEIELIGVEAINNDLSDVSCNVKLTIGGVDQLQSLNSVLYEGSKTGLLESISPRFGSVLGGETVTFTGTGFSSIISDVKVTIDGIDCPVQSASTTEIQCTTGSRPGLVATSLQIFIAGKGLVSLQDLEFLYVNYWSEETTWGGDFAPIEGESVYIPAGLNLFVDVDKTPVLNAIIVEGTLIFGPEEDSTHERYFDANYIYINGGRMEVGTEEFPYTSRLTITMHGELSDPYIPLYGNKCIGLRNGILDMQGVKREPTWTVLETTAEANSTQITLRQAVDWQVGEEIAIASTNFEGRDSERRTITAIDRTNPDKPVLTLNEKLTHRHFAATETYGASEIDMRAEVGLLTRNVKFRGDPETSGPNQYGAIIFMHSLGDDSLIARLAYTEFTETGQAFKVGRYTIHFHLIGAVHKSYAKGLSIHQTYNRAITLHGVQYLRIEDNVGQDIMGHAIFFEDAVERYNYIARNLIMTVKRSWSLLNTDQTPACFWITNPQNYFIENHAAGSDRYSYWFDLQIHAIGPSATNDVCPENEPLGEFRDNHAHSNGRYGLRIFHNLVPRKYPCRSINFDPDYEANGQTDPYWRNPMIPANFYRLTSWKNKRNGAIAEKVGTVNFIDFKTADNLLAGMEFSLTNLLGDKMASVQGGTVVGRSLGNLEPDVIFDSPHGIITPRTENFYITGVSFYNFNWDKAAALGTCSHCFHPAATDSGARTIKLSDLTFDESVTKRIRYQLPWRAIFFDEDGSLTGKGPGSWATFYYNHHNVSECEHLEDLYNGVVCDNTIQVRRLAFHDWRPYGLFTTQPMFILPIDDYLFEGKTEEEIAEYYENKENYGKILFKDKQNPSNAWAFPFVTGHKYKISWGLQGLDFERMVIDMSDRWEDTDKPVYLVHNFSDVRALMDVEVNGDQFFENETIPSKDLASGAEFRTGQNILYEDPSVEEFHLVLKGNSSVFQQRVILTAHRCDGPCNEEIEEVETEDTQRFWSDPNNWPGGELPKEGDDINIEPGWDMILDIEETPIFNLIRINGKLTFKQDMNITLNAKHIFIRAGELHIGSEEEPYENQANIVLHGEKDFEAIVYDNAIEAGNKLIANVGTVKMFGKKRTKNILRLHKEALKGQTAIRVETGLDLQKGDRLGIVPTSFDFEASDDVFVESYNSDTGVVELSSPLQFYHWGAPESTADKYEGLDVRGEVLVLTRNIRIYGEDVEAWGAQFVTSDTVEIYGADITVRQGQTILDSVEFYNCSQIDTFKAALRFEGAVGKFSKVTNSAIHNGLSWGVNIKSSANIFMQDNIIFSFKPIGLSVSAASNITLDGNMVANIYERIIDALGSTADARAGYALCSYWYNEGETCTDLHVTNNIAAGVSYAGFITYGHDCGDYSGDNFKDNIAHSVAGFKGGMGAYIFPDPTKLYHEEKCFEGSRFTAYKCALQGAFTFQTMYKVVFSKMLMLDNAKGMGTQMSVSGTFPQQKKVDDKNIEYDELLMEFNDNIFYGEIGLPDCPAKFNPGDFCVYKDKFAIFPSAVANKGKSPHITSTSALPPQKIKGDSMWGGRTIWRRTQFRGFKRATQSGMKHTVFGSSHYQPDYTPMLEFYDTVFSDVENDAVAHLGDPLEAWIDIADCGNFPCSAPNNMIISLTGTKWYGDRPVRTSSDFQIIHSNPGFAPYAEDCYDYSSTWNAYYCENENLGILLFESMDDERWDRALQPVYVSREGTDMKNKLNAMMDHVWDGFYTGQTRLARFPSIVDTPRGSEYQITYSGTPPKSQQFKLIPQKLTGKKVSGTTIRIAYPSAGSYSVKVNGKLIEMNKWEEDISQYGPIKQRFCGENRFIGVKNILEFYIDDGCVLQVVPRDAIQTMVRMEWTLEEFFSSGGTTRMVDRITAALGIHFSEVKVVSVYEGSLVFNYEIQPESGESKDLEKLNERQQSLYATGKMDLGAPILDVQAQVTSSSSISPGAPQMIITDGVVTADGFDPIVITTTESNVNGGQIKDEFKPDVDISTQEKTEQEKLTNQVTIHGKGKKQQQVVIVEKTSTAMIIVIAAMGILVFASFLAGIRYVRFQQQREDIEAAIRQKKKEEYEAACKNKQEIEMFASPNSSNSRLNLVTKGGQPNTGSKLMEDQVMADYDKQFDPQTDFDVFSKQGVSRLGLQQKANQADEQSSDEDASAGVSSLAKTPQTMVGTGSKHQNSSNESNLSEEGLPEDKEIHEEPFPAED